MKDEREVVLLALLSYEKNGTFSNVLVRKTLDGCERMSTAEKAFIKRLLEGVIERQTELDARIEHFTGRSVSRLHPAVHQILRMGIYQIYYMDSVPDSAVCNEAVRLAKRHGPARLSGFVNGVLRNAAREAASGEAGDEALLRRKEAGAAAKAGGASSGNTSAGSASSGSASADGTIAGNSSSGSASAGSTIAGDSSSGSVSAGSASSGSASAGSASAGGTIAGDSSSGSAFSGSTQTLSLKYSMPEWLVDLWSEQLGVQETEKLLSALMEIRPVSVRLSGRLTQKEREELLGQLSRAGVVIEDGRWLSDCLHLRKTSDLRKLPGFSEGLWTVQDESSMLAVEAMGLTGGEIVLDLCAAPGGKSFFAAERLACLKEETGREGTVFSYDLTRRKTDLIREGAKRLRLDNIRVAERDAGLFFEEDEGRADVVLCDLPCSGLGVIGKKRDIKYRASLEGLSSLQELQRRILTNAARYLKSGGVLIYSTCTINRDENEENAAWIEKELGLRPEDLTAYLPQGIPGIQGGMLRLLPHVHGTDGFFISRFRKE